MLRRIRTIKKKVKIIFCAVAAVCAVVCFLPVTCQAGMAGSEQISALSLKGIQWESLPGGGTRLKIFADGLKAGRLEPLIDPEESGRRLMDFFILGLNVREDKFWANLTPGDPDNIIDPDLAGTPLGEVMLRADLRLKKDFCELTNPQFSQSGKKYWAALSEKAAELGIKKIPAMNRVWIVPEEAAVYEARNGAYITESRLKVCLKINYSAGLLKDGGGKAYGELSEYAGELVRDIILPELDKRVNEDFLYADLRQVNRALILARWYNNKFGDGRGFNLKNTLTASSRPEINAGLLKKQIYDDYMDSLSNGEYVVVGPSGWSSALDYLRPKKRYISGGVDLRKSPARRSPAPAAAWQGRDPQFTFLVEISAQAVMSAGDKNNAINDFSVIGNIGDNNVEGLIRDLPGISPSRNNRDAETDINKGVISDTVLYSL
ncbi:MAG: hypothetical protein PHH68_07190 [Candidatus Omnitrophica bacterium]|nr:hypothetical protein [Candidatus Omnitrophota bacterium]